MNVEIKEGTKVIYKGSVPGLLLLTGSLVKRDGKQGTETYRLVARTWGPPNLLASLALGGIRHLGQLRVLASKDKAWLEVWQGSQKSAIKEAKRKLFTDMVRLVNQYAPLVMQVQPVVQMDEDVKVATVNVKSRIREVKGSKRRKRRG